MPVDDLWYASQRDASGQRQATLRHGRGKRWRVRWIDDQGRHRTQAFARRPDAERHDALMRAAVHRGDYIDPVASKTTIDVYSIQWRGQQLWDPATSELVERAVRLHILPMLGRLQVGQVRTSHVKAWVKDRAVALAPTTLRVVYSYLVAMFGAAVLDRLIGVSPCNRTVKLPDVMRGELLVPTGEQVEALGRALPVRYGAQPTLAAATGLRQGEVWGLELRHVDLQRREVRVEQQVKVTKERPRPYLAPPKTTTSHRTVELAHVGVEALRRHLERFSPDEVEIDDLTNPRRPVRRTARLVFTNARGEPIRRSGWSHIWTPAVAAADLPKGFGFHGLRHFFATALIFGGANVKTVQLALGHATPTTTLNTYVGLWPDAVDTTRVLVDAAFGRPAR